MVVVTTFSEEGYNIYGKRWIDSVSKFWPKNVVVNLYVDFIINDLPNNFNIIPFQKTFPEHKEFSKKVLSRFANTPKSQVIGRKTVKFSYKGFVINHALKTNNDLVIWLDGDVETIKMINQYDIEKTLEDKFLACQTEKQDKSYPHIESGILIFNGRKKESRLFQEKFEEYYYTNKLFNIKKPYDGYVIGRVLKEQNFLFYDFNKDFNISGKMSNKNDTFLHPFLKQRFIHWIGQEKS